MGAPESAGSGSCQRGSALISRARSSNCSSGRSLTLMTARPVLQPWSGRLRAAGPAPESSGRRWRGRSRAHVRLPELVERVPAQAVLSADTGLVDAQLVVAVVVADGALKAERALVGVARVRWSPSSGGCGTCRTRPPWWWSSSWSVLRLFARTLHGAHVSAGQGGSRHWTRTSNLPVNSRLLCQLS